MGVPDFPLPGRAASDMAYLTRNAGPVLCLDRYGLPSLPVGPPCSLSLPPKTKPSVPIFLGLSTANVDGDQFLLNEVFSSTRFDEALPVASRVPPHQ